MDLVYISLIIAALAVIIGIYRRTLSYLAIMLSSILMAVFTFRQYDLTSYFALIAAISWILISIFSIQYSKNYGRWLTPLFALTVFGMMLILEANNYILLIVGWEIMSIPAYASIGLNRKHYNAAFVFMAFSEISTIFIIIGAVFAFIGSGNLDFSFNKLNSDLPLLLIALGAMTKMGITPFMISEWLPIAHGNAPANDSAIFSATMTLMGVFLIVKVMLLSPSSIYLGILFMAIGGLSVFFSSLFAYVSENMKMLGGFSTIENNGSLLSAIGLYLAVSGELRQYMLVVILIFALAHSVAKTGLFMKIGSTGKESFADIQEGEDRYSTLGTLLITMSLSGLFPTLGGLAVWMLLEAFFMGAYLHGIIGIASIIMGSIIALAEGFASAAMMKVLSFSRSLGSARKDRKGLMQMSIFLTGVTMVLLFGIATILIIPEFIGGLPSVLVLNGFTVESSLTGSDFGLVSPLYILGLLSLFSIMTCIVFGKPRERSVPRWNGGVDFNQHFTSFTYSNNTRIMLRGILRTKIGDPDKPVSVVDIFWISMQRFATGYRKFARYFAYKVMNSSIAWYMIYMILAFIGVIIIVSLA